MPAIEQTRVDKELKPELNDFQLLVQRYQLSMISALASYFDSAGTPEKGVDLMISALEKWPEEPELYEKLVFLASKAGKTAEAEKNLLKAQILLSETPFVYSSLGKLYFLKREFSSAREQLGKSIQLNPEDGVNLFFSALSGLAILCEDKRTKVSELPEIQQIEKDLQKLIEFKPEMATDDFFKGKELLAQNNYTEAFEHLEKSLNSYLNNNAEFTRFHQFFFSFYMEPEKFDLDDLKKYIQELEKKLSLSMSSEKEFNQLGCCYILFFLNLVKSSEEQLERALILDSEFEGTRKAMVFLEKMKTEMLPLIDSLRF
jgi:tetratricopeptide (TPR) repeat protein